MLAVYAQYPTFTVFLAVFLGALVTMVLMPFWIRGLKKHLTDNRSAPMVPKATS